MNRSLCVLLRQIIRKNRQNSHFSQSALMANSRFDYVKEFECDDRIIPNCWIVVRVDGKAFHKFSNVHNFQKPNDDRALNLMSHAAITVMKEFLDIVLCYGQSDEYSFIFHKSTAVYNRRSAKIMTNVNSLFTAAYCFNWTKWFGEQKLCYPPSFDARIVVYPSDENLRDYVSWRQADVHINNLYNTCFWNLVKSGLSTTEAENQLKGTFSSDKNELLFSKFNINYNNLPELYRKGTILLRKRIQLPNSNKKRVVIIPLNIDLIRDQFWLEHTEILTKKSPQFYKCQTNEQDFVAELSPLILQQLKNVKISTDTFEIDAKECS